MEWFLPLPTVFMTPVCLKPLCVSVKEYSSSIKEEVEIGLSNEAPA